MPLELTVLPGRLAICRLAADADIPQWAMSGPLSSATRTQSELSVICEESAVPEGVTAECGWRALMVCGPLDFALTGVLLALLGPLADARISVFAVSTFDTDFLLVKELALKDATKVLTEAGHRLT